MKTEELELPCVECCMQDLSCCKNPQIVWTLEEMDNLYANFPEAFKDITIGKGEIPGTMYLIRIPKDDIDAQNNVRIEYCAMYDVDNRRCGVYSARPSVCRTYGDPEYATCPYTDYREQGALEALARFDIKLADKLHSLAPTNPENYLRDFITPWVERFDAAKKDHPEYWEYWEKLPTLNFKRR